MMICPCSTTILLALSFSDASAAAHDGVFFRYGQEVVADHGDWLGEHVALRTAVGIIDLSFRGRLCLTGADRVRLLNGQVTNNVKDLPAGAGCYAALVTNKGKMQSDLNIYMLPDEILLDFEPGLSAEGWLTVMDWLVVQPMLS